MSRGFVRIRIFLLKFDNLSKSDIFADLFFFKNKSENVEVWDLDGVFAQKGLYVLVDFS